MSIFSCLLAMCMSSLEKLSGTTEIVFLTIVEAANPKSRCQQGGGLVGDPLLVHGWEFLAVSMHGERGKQVL